MALRWIVSTTPPTPDPQWYAPFDNTYWSVSFPGASWDGSKWVSSISATLPLTELGTWVEGYRPTKIRVTATAGTGPLQLVLADGDSNIVNENPYVSGTEVDITGQVSDIASLTVSASGQPINVTNIEFYSTTDPT